MLPTEVTKDIRKMKDAPTRILVTILLLAICTITTAYYRATKDRLNDCEERCNKQDLIIESMKRKIDSLTTADFVRAEAENIRLKNRVAWQDSIKQVLQSVIDRQH